MSDYRDINWKRNIRKIPDAILSKLANMEESSIVAVCVKPIKISEIEDNVYSHLGIKIKSGSVHYENLVTPPVDMGPYSSKNTEGWEVKRTDLPKIKKTIYRGDRPIYGDWSNGSFALWSEMEVYQREFHEPRDYTIHIDLIKEPDAASAAYLFKFQVECVLDKSDVGFEDNLLFCLNLLQENTGACGVDSSEKSRNEYISTIVVDWEIFPPGSLDAFLTKFKRRVGKISQDQETIISERVTEFSKLKPESYIQGKGGFNYYIGAKVHDNLVIFENVRYGNALYVIYDSWESVSKRSRSDLIRGTDADFERIPHVAGWPEQLRIAVRKGRAKH